jgi:putative flippase GtrA
MTEKRRPLPQTIISLLIILLSYGYLLLLLFYPVPTENRDIVNVSASSIISLCVGGVIGYWFSASHFKKLENQEANSETTNSTTTP